MCAQMLMLIYLPIWRSAQIPTPRLNILPSYLIRLAPTLLTVYIHYLPVMTGAKEKEDRPQDRP